MKRSLVAVLLISVSISACGKKDDNCIDPNTFENKCIEAQIQEQSIDLGQQSQTIVVGQTEPSNLWPNEKPHTIVVERKVYVEKPHQSSLLPTVGGIVGGWLGKKYADRQAQKQIVIVPPAPAPRVIPIVPNAKPYVPSKPTYSYSRPTYSSPTVTVRRK